MLDDFGEMVLSNEPLGEPGLLIEKRDSGEGLGIDVDWVIYRNDEGRPIAFMICREHEDGKRRVLGYVAKDFRRQGVATKVWTEAAGMLGLNTEDQYANEDTKAFFRSLD